MAHGQSIDIRLAQASDLKEILELLKDSEMPVEDLVSASPAQFLVARRDDATAGCVGIELTGRYALIRSLAVGKTNRGEGIGSRLLQAAEDLCQQQGVRAVYLLTLTAEPFFARRGYWRADRAMAPSDIAGSREFSSICPVSAAFMAKTL
jgi:amino-acid N-acetyltransferase